MSETTSLKQVLVADDSQTIHKAVRLTLPENEFNVVVAHTGKEALDLVKETHFDLVLADVNMPELNGYDLAQAIKVRLAKTDLPVILMCGTFDKFDQDRFIWSKANHRIWKPFETTSFIEIIRQYIQPENQVVAEPVSESPVPEIRFEHETPVMPVKGETFKREASRQEVVTETQNRGFQVEKEVRKWLASDAGKDLLQELVKREVQEVLARLEQDLIRELQKEPLEKEDVPARVNLVNPF